MKYARLTKEQFEELNQEFINFLATQSITANEWKDIKQNKPEMAEQELDVFSDLIWEGVLKQVDYVEHISPQQMHLFHFAEEYMHAIAIKLSNGIDITTTDGYNWLRENLMDDDVEFQQAKKNYTNDRNADKFQLIQQGGTITKGDLFSFFDNLIN